MLRFSGITIFRPTVAQQLKHIRTLPERDAYVGKVGAHDPELAKGNYDWWGMPDRSVMFLTGKHIEQYRHYKNAHDVRLQDHGGATNSFYKAIDQQAHNFVQEQLKQWEPVRFLPRPPSVPEQLRYWRNTVYNCLMTRQGRLFSVQ